MPGFQRGFTFFRTINIKSSSTSSAGAIQKLLEDSGISQGRPGYDHFWKRLKSMIISRQQWKFHLVPSAKSVTSSWVWVYIFAATLYTVCSVQLLWIELRDGVLNINIIQLSLKKLIESFDKIFMWFVSNDYANVFFPPLLQENLFWIFSTMVQLLTSHSFSCLSFLRFDCLHCSQPKFSVFLYYFSNPQLFVSLF